MQAGPHNRQEEPVPDGKEPEEEAEGLQSREDDDKERHEVEEEEVDMKGEEEGMKLEIMLGMTQEEGLPCLLCLLPIAGIFKV